MPRKAAAAKAFAKIPNLPLKLDLGCGPNTREGFEGVDAIAFPGVKHVFDLRQAPWPWDDASVGEAHASHFLEHLTAEERVRFFNELHRVLVPGGTCQIITPHWASCRAYGDPTHVWPPVSEFVWYYLDRNWRVANAPHTDKAHWAGGFDCDFDSTWAYTLHPAIASRNQEHQMYALANFKEAAQDMICTVKARK